MTFISSKLGGSYGTYSTVISHCIRGTYKVVVSENQTYILSLFSDFLIALNKLKTSTITEVQKLIHIQKETLSKNLLTSDSDLVSVNLKSILIIQFQHPHLEYIYNLRCIFEKWIFLLPFKMELK